MCMEISGAAWTIIFTICDIDTFRRKVLRIQNLALDSYVVKYWDNSLRLLEPTSTSNWVDVERE